MSLNVLDAVPPGLFGLPASQLVGALGGPTLLRIPGVLNPPLFVSVLLHGNETSGWDAVRRLLASGHPPKRSILLFIGNVEAAALGLRSAPGQMDFNRIWTGEHSHTPMVQALLAQLHRQPPFVALDMHNNTGKNPHYSVLTQITPQTTALAYLFSDQAVLVEEPDSVLTRAVQTLCPATTVEVGPIGDPRSTDRSAQLLRTYMALESIPEDRPAGLRLHRALARVHVAADIVFDFADALARSPVQEQDLILTAGMEAVNFHPVPAGTEFGFTRQPLHRVLKVLDAQHRDVTREFLVETHGDVTLARPVIPAMYTLDQAVIRQDCLCYFMEAL